MCLVQKFEEFPLDSGLSSHCGELARPAGHHRGLKVGTRSRPVQKILLFLSMEPRENHSRLVPEPPSPGQSGQYRGPRRLISAFYRRCRTCFEGGDLWMQFRLGMDPGNNGLTGRDPHGVPENGRKNLKISVSCRATGQAARCMSRDLHHGPPSRRHLRGIVVTLCGQCTRISVFRPEACLLIFLLPGLL